jgi:hypothetical protein
MRRVDLSQTSAAEEEALLRLRAECERQELALPMLQRRPAQLMAR